MNVIELIEALEDFPPDMKVVLCLHDKIGYDVPDLQAPLRTVTSGTPLMGNTRVYLHIEENPSAEAIIRRGIR